MPNFFLFFPAPLQCSSRGKKKAALPLKRRRFRGPVAKKKEIHIRTDCADGLDWRASGRARQCWALLGPRAKFLARDPHDADALSIS